jgi:hypothetical protein
VSFAEAARYFDSERSACESIGSQLAITTQVAAAMWVMYGG